MAFGILNVETGGKTVPGTCQLEGDDLDARNGLRRMASGDYSDIVLIPQPTSDPNDPLNWPLWQRDLILLLLSYCTNICVGGIGPLVSTIGIPILQEFDVTYKDVSLLIGYQLAVVGAMAPIVSSLSWKYGKRPVYLVSMAFLLTGSIVCSVASSYDILLGGRLLQGVGTAAFESITFSAVGDLYFVHQRGLRMALYVCSAVGMVLVPSLIAGIVAESLAWRWSFGILSIAIGIGTVGIILFGWETSFTRCGPLEMPSGYCQSKPGVTDSKETVEVEQADTINSSSAVTHKRLTCVQRMKPWSGVFDDRSLVMMALEPFKLIANPVVCWTVIITAFAQLWNVVVSMVLAQMFSPPPYSLNSAQMGYLNTGPIIAGLLSSIACGIISDKVTLLITKRNNGVYEPEFRLLLILLAPIFSTLGYFLFGHLSEKGESPVLVSFVWGLAFVSAQVVSTATGGYLVDAYRDVDVTIFVLAMSVKNFLFFGASFFINDWITLWGSARVFQCIGGIMLGLCFTTIPVYVYGKKARFWWYG